VDQNQTRQTLSNTEPIHQALADRLPSIAMGGGDYSIAADGSAAPRRHPDWIKARIPSGETYQ
jgi:hypothetical protein